MKSRTWAWAIGLAGAAVAGRSLWRAATACSFRNKVVLITGGSRGLGLVLARRFVGEGAAVVICARDRDEILRALRDLHRRGGEASGWVADLTDPNATGKLVREIADRYGRLDVIVNNAGIIQLGPLDSMSLADFHEAMDSDFWSAVHVVDAALPQLRRSRGRIVNIASIGGKVAVPHLLPYCAAKFALVGYSRGLRAELAKDGIVVTTVCPGLMRTGSHSHALFKGQHENEYALFSTIGSLPLMSIPAETAADRILDACRHGDAEAILGVVTRSATLLNELCPEATSAVLGLVAGLLPGGAGPEGIPQLGSLSHSRMAPSLLTAPNELAASRNNE